MSATDSKSTSKPWNSWDFELPASNEFKEVKEGSIFTDEKFIREMAGEQRERLLALATKHFTAANSAIAVKGGVSQDFELYDSDTEKCTFRQEAFFRYLFPINEPDCYGVIDVSKKESLLFVPYTPDEWERWNGERRELEYYTKRYGVTAAFWVRDLHKVLQERGIKNLYILSGVNSDSGNAVTTKVDFPELKEYQVNETALYPVLSELRVHKTEKEVQLLRAANIVSSQAHVYVMRHVKPGMSELQLEILYKAWAGYYGAARHMAYTCICGSGNHGAILHYGHAGRPNDKVIVDQEFMVLDMGAEYAGYATDITRSYPANGKYTPQQRVVHTAVYESQMAVLKVLKPGASWQDMHRLSERVILEHLLKANVLHNGTVDEMMAANIGAVFMPHGLGHLLGMHVHDVGGYPEGHPERSKEPGLCWLRTARKMEAGMVVTVEPGCYFNDKWIDRALADPARAKFFNVQELAKYRGMGGCRLEDDVLITADGCENMTILPTTVDEIEAVMSEARQGKKA